MANDLNSKSLCLYPTQLHRRNNLNIINLIDDSVDSIGEFFSLGDCTNLTLLSLVHVVQLFKDFGPSRKKMNTGLGMAIL